MEPGVPEEIFSENTRPITSKIELWRLIDKQILERIAFLLSERRRAYNELVLGVRDA